MIPVPHKRPKENSWKTPPPKIESIITNKIMWKTVKINETAKFLEHDAGVIKEKAKVKLNSMWFKVLNIKNNNTGKYNIRDRIP